MKGRRFSSDVEVIAAAETWLDGQPYTFFLSRLQKLEHWTKKCIELRIFVIIYMHFNIRTPGQECLPYLANI